MVRMVIHAGFHKTGTSSIQKMLRQNKKLLHPYGRIILKPGVATLCDATRLWSRWRDRFEQRGVEIELELLFGKLKPKAGRTILISAEDLAGHMPGRKGVTRYDATAPLMQMIAEAALKAPFKINELVFFFSTRAADGWLKSSYVQHVRGDRMTLSLQDYAAQFADAANLNAVVDDVRQAVAPHPVHSAALEDAQNQRLGPLSPLLDILNVPDAVRAQMQAFGPVNAAPSADLLHQMLALNCSDLNDTEVHARKQTLLEAAQNRG